jgi:hypothetical protein
MRADSVCVAFNAKLPPRVPPVGLGAGVALATRHQMLRETELSALRRLTAPAGQRPAYARYLSELMAQNDLFATLLAALKNGNGSREKDAYPRSLRLDNEVTGEARAVGLTECAKPRA